MDEHSRSHYGGRIDIGFDGGGVTLVDIVLWNQTDLGHVTFGLFYLYRPRGTGGERVFGSDEGIARVGGLRGGER